MPSISVGLTDITRSMTRAASRLLSNLSYKKYKRIGAICIISSVVVTAIRFRSG